MRRAVVALAAVLVVAAVLALPACRPRLPEGWYEACGTDTDCPGQLQCEDVSGDTGGRRFVCTASCQRNDDCPDDVSQGCTQNGQCQDGVCTTARFCR